MSNNVARKRSASLPAHWRLAETDEAQAQAAARRLGVPAELGGVVLRLLGLGHPEATLFGGLEAIEDDSAFDGQPGWELSKAAAAIRRAAEKQGRVYLHGDSDTDGITGTLVVHRALAHYFPAERILVDMPDPLDHYGFGMKRAERALEFGADVIITMDCGTNNTDEVAFVSARGAQVVVLDHHEIDPGRPYPEAVMVNGKVLHQSKNLARLSTGGLAWRFSNAVHRAMGTDPGATDHGASLAYVALSTVVDVVPLVGDNRILVREGLKYLNDLTYATPALVALRQLAKVPYGRSTLQSFDLGFRLGPLLNLGKRLPSVSPQEIYDLLAYEQEPGRIEQQMIRFGLATKERREKTASYKEAALAFIRKYWSQQEPEFVKLAVISRCERGIVGLVAQNVAQHFKQPAIVLTDDPSGDPAYWYGSGRSPLDLDLLGMVNATGLAVGHGHRQAVGGIRLKKTDLPAFKEAMWRAARSLGEQDPLLFSGAVDVMGFVPVEDWTPDLAAALNRLVQPTGQGNPTPTFAAGPYLCTAVTDGGRYAVYQLEQGDRIVEVRRLGEGSADADMLNEEVHVLYEVQMFNGQPSFVARELRRREALAKAA